MESEMLAQVMADMAKQGHAWDVLEIRGNQVTVSFGPLNCVAYYIFSENKLIDVQHD